LPQRIFGENSDCIPSAFVKLSFLKVSDMLLEEKDKSPISKQRKCLHFLEHKLCFLCHKHVSNIPLYPLYCEVLGKILYLDSSPVVYGTY
jgi:hypothetical protein